ncbi:MAG: Do family serine endopeptidase [Nitrospirales bacterium]|nr:Do family serine endopeptidase [Nitrospira sp.]MDR4462179.1 Do family serine endopeptidase [Nitrospirales bacterium]
MGRKKGKLHFLRLPVILSSVMAMWIGCGGVVALSIGMDRSVGWAGDPSESSLGRIEETTFMQGGFADVAQTVTPAVVNITATVDIVESRGGGVPLPFEGFSEGKRPPGLPKRQKGSGSGVILSSEGYIVTNNHVIAESRDLIVTLPDAREFPARVVGADPETDLAVIKIQTEDLPVIPWGNSSSLAVGQYVLAIGNPFGLNSTVTLGIVSALDRGGMGLARFEDFIQTDAAINPGNSGGALVNTYGELIGINTAIASQSGGYQGVGFAVPSSLAKPVVDELIQKGKVVRGYIGLGVQEITTELAPWFGLKGSDGVLVTDVVPGAPADKAGIRRGDIIQRYQGQTVKDGRMLLEQVTRAPIGQHIELGIIESGKERKVRVVILEQPLFLRSRPTRTTSLESPLTGVEVADIDEAAVQEYGLNPGSKGALVSFVEEGCAAELAGIIEGDVIIELNKHPVDSVREYSSWYKRLRKEQAVLVVLVRSSRHLYVVVKSS